MCLIILHFTFNKGHIRSFKALYQLNINTFAQSHTVSKYSKCVATLLPEC